MAEIEVRGTHAGQAPPLACCLVLGVALGLVGGFLFWPAWVVTGAVVLWVVMSNG